MVGEGLHVGQVVVRTVLLQPFADVLLRPEHDGPDQAGLRGAGVIYPIVVTVAVLQQGQKHRRREELTPGRRRDADARWRSAGGRLFNIRTSCCFLYGCGILTDMFGFVIRIKKNTYSSYSSG